MRGARPNSYSANKRQFKKFLGINEETASKNSVKFIVFTYINHDIILKILFASSILPQKLTDFNKSDGRFETLSF